MKKPFKVLSTGALAAVLATSSLVPVMSTEAATNYAATDVIFAKDGVNYTVDVATYNELLDASKVDELSVTHVVSNGVNFAIEEYNEALDAKGDALAALELLAASGTPITVVTEKAVFDENGNQVTTPVTEDLKVESVSAINGTQLQVKFTEAIDAGTVITNGTNVIKNITVNAATGAAATGQLTGSLSTDGKTLTITAANALAGSYTVTVDNTVATSGDEPKYVEVFTKTISVKDEVAPTLSSVEAKTSLNNATSATLTFSEPVASLSVKVNGVTVPNAQVSVSGNEVILTGLTLSKNKTHSVQVINVTDEAGNVKDLESKTFSVTVDTAAPQASLSVDSDNVIKLTFDKSVKPGTVTSTSVKLFDEDLTSLTAGGTDFTLAPVANTNDKVYTLTFASGYDLYLNDTTRKFTVMLTDAITDTLGNKLSASNSAVTLTQNETAPKFVKSVVTTDVNGDAEFLKLTFDKELTSAIDASKITAKNATTGVTEAVASLIDTSAVVYSTDGKTVSIPVKPAGLGKKVNFTFAKAFVSDTAYTPNDSSAFTTQADFTASQGTFAITQAEVTSTAATRVIKVDYTQGVLGDFTAAAANNPANYTINGEVLPENTDIVLTAAGVATITLPTGFISTSDTDAIFTVKNVKNASGVVVKSFIGKVDVKDTKAPEFSTAVFNADGTITLSFSEAIATVGSKDAFEIKLNDSKLLAAANYTVASGTGADAGKVVVTLVSGTDSVTNDKFIDLGTTAATTFNPAEDLLVSEIYNAVIKILDGSTDSADAAANAAKVGLKATATK